MALIKCPECDKEISDTVKKCPNCGYNLKSKENKKNKKIIFIVVAVILLVAVIGGIVGMGINKSNAEKKEKEYNELITTTGGKIYVYGLISELQCYDIGQIWYNSIFKKSDYKYDKYTRDPKYPSLYNDFNKSINNYTTENAESIQKLKETKNELGNDIKKLKDLPNDSYQDVYDELIVFYGVFSKLVDSATSPSGTYKDYLTNYNTYSKEFQESYDKIIVLKPEIKDYKEKTN